MSKLQLVTVRVGLHWWAASKVTAVLPGSYWEGSGTSLLVWGHCFGLVLGYGFNLAGLQTL